MPSEYDPLDFAHGIDVLEEAVTLGDTRACKSILELMLSDLDALGGNMHRELQSYISTLFLFPGDPIDIAKVRTLHGELALNWASSASYEFSKSRSAYRARQKKAGQGSPYLPQDKEEIIKNAKRRLRAGEATRGLVNRIFDQRGQPSIPTIRKWLQEENILPPSKKK